MIAKIFVTVGVLVYVVLIPYLEINASHVFNDSWPPHARLHEVWQLTTNMVIGAVALYLAWGRSDVRLASVLNMAVMGGVLVAHGLADGYGGSIMSGNVASTVVGLPLAVFVAGVVVALAIAAMMIGDRRAAGQFTD